MSCNDQRGFTITELVIAMTAFMVVVVGLVGAMTEMIGTNSIAITRLQETNDTQTALDMIEGDVAVSKTFLVSPDSNMVDPYGPDNSGGPWNYTTDSVADTQNVLLLRMFATTTSVRNSAKQPVYLNTIGCSAQLVDANPPMTVNVIYFVRNQTLYRRVLVDNTQPTCQTPYQSETCPSDVSLPKNARCQGTDTMLMTGVTNFSAQFFVANAGRTGGSVVPLPTDQPTLDGSEGVSVSITTTRSGQAVSYSAMLYCRKDNS